MGHGHGYEVVQFPMFFILLFAGNHYEGWEDIEQLVRTFGLHRGKKQHLKTQEGSTDLSLWIVLGGCEPLSFLLPLNLFLTQFHSIPCHAHGPW